MKIGKIVTERDSLCGSTPAPHFPLMIVGPVEDDAGLPLDRFGWRICRAPSCRGFLFHAIRMPPRVVVCERDLRDGSWKDVLEIASRLVYPPPVIVTSRLADERLWAEVLNLGGYDVLAKPLDIQEVTRTLSLACERLDSQSEPVRRAGAARNGSETVCLTA